MCSSIARLNPCGHAFDTKCTKVVFERATEQAKRIAEGNDDIPSPTASNIFRPRCPTCRALLIGDPIECRGVEDLISAVEREIDNSESDIVKRVAEEVKADIFEGGEEEVDEAELVRSLESFFNMRG